ncbi:hypothetical protein NB037_07945 [Rathayibacter sp. ZW T2_19]|uniref:Uncharacterized protein n=1 Tax=Rathayibacter rubneri TaxID=2950106 RepID=A0A9X2DZ35_9MICO|nr:hypothetical protein [Rathayibacter rubneri]MCM6762348.1 hypothetical protein [Rathayibacter rubneri]
MSAERTPRRRSLVFLLAGIAIGALAVGSLNMVASWLPDDSRSSITLQDVVRDGLAGFADAPKPSGDACGDRRRCVEGVEGADAAIYRYRSLDLARQAVIYSDADFYRSDQLVVEFKASITTDERFQLIQGVEGTWTGSDD